MRIDSLKSLMHDDSGKGLVKFALGSCTLAAAVAMASPGFKANPLLGKTVNEMRERLPETLQKVTHAMGG